jgi:hypothetical protein
MFLYFPKRIQLFVFAIMARDVLNMQRKCYIHSVLQTRFILTEEQQAGSQNNIDLLITICKQNKQRGNQRYRHYAHYPFRPEKCV